MHRSVQAKTEKEDCKLVGMNINSAVFKILFKKMVLQMFHWEERKFHKAPLIPRVWRTKEKDF